MYHFLMISWVMVKLRIAFNFFFFFDELPTNIITDISILVLLNLYLFEELGN